MAHFKVNGSEYPLPDFDTITFDEGRAIKAVTGLRMGELLPAFNAGDSDAMLALFIVAKSRVDGSQGVADLGSLKIVDLEIVDDEDAAGEVAEDAVPLAPKRSPRPKSSAKPS